MDDSEISNILDSNVLISMRTYRPPVDFVGNLLDFGKQTIIII